MTYVDLADPLSEDLAQILEVLGLYASSNPLADPEDEILVTIAGGGEYVLDNCCPGVAWARPVSFYPSNSFPSPVPGEIRCPPPMWAATIELGIARCATALPDEAGNLPSTEAVAYDAAIANYDRSALIQAAVCGVAPLYDNRIALDAWTPMETSGGCLGSTINITVPARFCCDPLIEG